MNKIKVLCYHRVENIDNDFNMLAVTPENFKEHMRFLKENYDIISLDKIFTIADDLKRDTVVITFDDGYYDLLYNALPILEELEVSVTMFISTGNIGTRKENWTDSILRALFQSRVHHDEFFLNDDTISCVWSTKSMQERMELYRILRVIFQSANRVKREMYEKNLLDWAGLSEQGRTDRRMLTEDEIRQLSKSSFVTIGAHCVTHPSLKWLDADEQKWEIRTSKQELERIIKKEISLFSYPFGTINDYSESTIEILKVEGFQKAVTTQLGEITKETDAYRIPRVGIRNYNKKEFQDFIINRVFKNDFIYEKKKRGTNGITYIGRLENDHEIMNEQVKLVIWGSGFCGKEIFETLRKQKLDKIVIAFGDNDINKIGKQYYGREIKSAEEILNLQKIEKIIVAVKGKYAKEICVELIKKGFCNIHILIRD